MTSAVGERPRRPTASPRCPGSGREDRLVGRSAGSAGRGSRRRSAGRAGAAARRRSPLDGGPPEPVAVRRSARSPSRGYGARAESSTGRSRNRVARLARRAPRGRRRARCGRSTTQRAVVERCRERAARPAARRRTSASISPATVAELFTTTQVARAQVVGQVAEPGVGDAVSGRATSSRTSSRATPRASAGAGANVASGAGEPDAPERSSRMRHAEDHLRDEVGRPGSGRTGGRASSSARRCGTTVSAAAGRRCPRRGRRPGASPCACRRGRRRTPRRPFSAAEGQGQVVERGLAGAVRAPGLVVLDGGVRGDRDQHAARLRAAAASSG